MLSSVINNNSFKKHFQIITSSIGIFLEKISNLPKVSTKSTGLKKFFAAVKFHAVDILVKRKPLTLTHF